MNKDLKCVPYRIMEASVKGKAKIPTNSWSAGILHEELNGKTG
jgi:hypothetical protein